MPAPPTQAPRWLAAWLAAASAAATAVEHDSPSEEEDGHGGGGRNGSSRREAGRCVWSEVDAIRLVLGDDAISVQKRLDRAQRKNKAAKESSGGEAQRQAQWRPSITQPPSTMFPTNVPGEKAGQRAGASGQRVVRPKLKAFAVKKVCTKRRKPLPTALAAPAHAAIGDSVPGSAQADGQVAQHDDEGGAVARGLPTGASRSNTRMDGKYNSRNRSPSPSLSQNRSQSTSHGRDRSRGRRRNRSRSRSRSRHDPCRH
jgi:hypothetical protein